MIQAELISTHCNLRTSILQWYRLKRFQRAAIFEHPVCNDTGWIDFNSPQSSNIHSAMIQAQFRFQLTAIFKHPFTALTSAPKFWVQGRCCIHLCWASARPGWLPGACLCERKGQKQGRNEKTRWSHSSRYFLTWSLFSNTAILFLGAIS